MTKQGPHTFVREAAYIVADLSRKEVHDRWVNLKQMSSQNLKLRDELTIVAKTCTAEPESHRPQ